MSKSSVVDFTKSIFSSSDARGKERAGLPNSLVVGFIFTVLFIMAITVIIM